MPANDVRQIRILISGRVQGVGFRAFTQRIARQLSVKGFVRNLPDSRVEVVAQADAHTLDTFASKLAKGPSLARVDDIQVQKKSPGEFTGFAIRY